MRRSPLATSGSRATTGSVATPMGRLRTALLAALVLVLATAVAWSRLDPEQRATLWAEDGRDFVSAYFVDGLGATLFRPFGGYLQLVPRVIAAVSGTIAGPEHLAQTVTLLACAGVGAVSALLYLYSRTVLRTPVAPFLLAAVPPLIPTAPREALGTMNNLHSFLLLLVPVVLLAVPRSWWTSAGTAVLVVAVVLSDTQALLFAPLLLAGIRDRRKWPVVAAFLAAGAAQVATVVAFPRPAISYGASGPVTIADVVVGFVSVPLTTVWTTRLDAVSTLIADTGTAPIVALTVVCVAVAVAAMCPGRPCTAGSCPRPSSVPPRSGRPHCSSPLPTGSSSRRASRTTSRTSARSGTPPSARASCSSHSWSPRTRSGGGTGSVAPSRSLSPSPWR